MDRNGTNRQEASGSSSWRATVTLVRDALQRLEGLITDEESTTVRPSRNEEPRGERAPRDEVSSMVSMAGPSNRRERCTVTSREEVRRLFRPYQPDVSTRTFPRRSSSSKGKGKALRRDSECVTWKKDAICLRFRKQLRGPDTEEKMALARMGLGLKELVFNLEGDAQHIHGVLLKAFPPLEQCGGYNLMRLASNSTDLITITSPKWGMTVKYLREILRSAKLFIRPLQTDISIEHIIEDEDDGPKVRYSFL